MARTISPPRPTSTRRSPPASQRHSSSSTPTTTTSPSTTTTSNRSLASQRAAERPNIPIAPASSNTSSPIYSTTSSPPISPGISQYPGSSFGIMVPSRSDSRSTALAIDMPPTQTPTGRVSKAKKGKRVHACEFPGCGKIFTRAEHRRRHELNHNPDATYRCTQQGCGKSFHRLDLLQRHQERHELEASTQPSSPGGRRYPTQSSVMSESPAALPITSMASPQIPQPQSRTSAGMSIPSLMNHHSYHADPAAAFGMHPYMQLFSSAEGWEPIYVTDNSSPQSRGYHRSSGSATSSVAGFDPNSGSPMVPPSMPHGAWSQAPPPTVLPANMFEDGMPPYPSSMPHQYPSPIWTDTSGVTLDESYHLCPDYYPVLTEPAYPIL